MSSSAYVYLSIYTPSLAALHTDSLHSRISSNTPNIGSVFKIAFSNNQPSNLAVKYNETTTLFQCVYVAEHANSGTSLAPSRDPISSSGGGGGGDGGGGGGGSSTTTLPGGSSTVTTTSGGGGKHSLLSHYPLSSFSLAFPPTLSFSFRIHTQQMALLLLLQKPA